jgi:hypothetical protein
MRTEKQISVFLVNKPGVLASVTGALGKAKVDIIALTLADSIEHGVLRIVVKPVEEAKKVLTEMNLSVTETDVLCVDLPNRPGAIANVAETLAEAHVNISYAYYTVGAKGGRTTGVFKVSDIQKAMHVLAQAQVNSKRKRRSAKKIRREHAVR